MIQAITTAPSAPSTTAPRDSSAGTGDKRTGPPTNLKDNCCERPCNPPVSETEAEGEAEEAKTDGRSARANKEACTSDEPAGGQGCGQSAAHSVGDAQAGSALTWLSACQRLSDSGRRSTSAASACSQATPAG